MEKQESDKPRVLIFPLPIQGHVSAMLNLAELLSLSGLQVTFLNSDFVHNRLLCYTDLQTRFESYPGFQFKTITDGLPTDHPRTGEIVMDLFNSIASVTNPLLKQMLASGQLGSITCIISEVIFGSFFCDLGDEFQIPIIHFRTISACSCWVFFSLPNVIKACELPICGEEDMDRLIKSVPGMESFLRCRDLPSFFRASDMNNPILQIVLHETQQSRRAQANIINTFEDLEGPVLSSLTSNMCPNVYSIGPLHTQLKLRKLANKDNDKPTPSDHHNQSSNSLFEVDTSCLTWLDSKPTKSVIYVSFGSLAVLTKNQLMEFWYGLVNSKMPFLWVIRPDLIGDEENDINNGKVPEELLKGTKERGFMVGWAPQEQVLDHEAIGGFLTHSGWNSTLESITAGVPMICWPFFADQQLNSRYVSEIWKLGLDMKDICDRRIVEKMVIDLMVERRDEFQTSATEMAELARKSVTRGGTSFCNLNRLIEDIKFVRIGVSNKQI